MNERKERSDKGIKRGRTGADTPPAMQHQGLVEGSREEVAHSSGRPPRISMNNMKKLGFSEGLMEDGYYYRWFQDRDGRISQAQAAYYEPVTDEQGNNTTRQSGPYTMQLMRLLAKYRDEDLALKKAAVQATLETEAGIGHNEYAPDPETGRAEGGNSAIQRSVES